ncbi:MAG TPA: tripartite tricarboxylate transporter substrate binding protein [Burkholderiales bacterium]|nr:tripartite tricarboxylate transporter substrate binding protein [Burkholderiales bacterium]
MKSLRNEMIIALALGSSALAYAQTHAQTFPSKPIRLVVGYAPGGGTDLASRYVAAALSELWNTTVLVDNRPGAGGALGTEITAKAAPDGYTVMLCTIGSHAITPARIKLPYDHIRDFAFISMIGSTPNVLVVHPSQPMKNVGEFVAYARANPGKLSYGSSGVGASPHLSIELLKSMTGIDIVHVPYKGAAPALADVMGGQMPASVGNLPGGPLAAIKSGRVRGIGVTSGKRNPRAPDVPTFAEAGVPGYDVSSWYGICAPAGLTKPVLAKFNAGLVKVLSSPDLQQRMSEQGIDVTPSTPEQFLVHVKAETAKWAKVVKEAGLIGD